MVGKFAQGISDQQFSKNLLLAEQERSDDLAQELEVL